MVLVSDSQKLDQILAAISNLTNRVDELDKSMLSFGSRSNDTERKVNAKFEAFDNLLQSKADSGELVDLKSRLTKIKDINEQLEANAVMNESYEKIFSILIHGIPESDQSA